MGSATKGHPLVVSSGNKSVPFVILSADFVVHIDPNYSWFITCQYDHFFYQRGTEAGLISENGPTNDHPMRGLALPTTSTKKIACGLLIQWY